MLYLCHLLHFYIMLVDLLSYLLILSLKMHCNMIIILPSLAHFHPSWIKSDVSFSETCPESSLKYLPYFFFFISLITLVSSYLKHHNLSLSCLLVVCSFICLIIVSLPNLNISKFMLPEGRNLFV